MGECLMANDIVDKTRELQIKLYQAAKRSPSRRFHALFDKVCRKDFLQRGWDEVKRNRGAAGVDGVTIADVEEAGVGEFLDDLAVLLREGRYRPLPVRRVTIPKPQGGERHLGVPALRDRVVQAATRAVCEPIFEADFLDCSFGFRPKRSAHQALDVIRTEVNKGRVWVVDADIEKFFDNLDRDVLVAALQERISDRRVLALVKGWLAAGVVADGGLSHPEAGTPQGGVISPLLANVVLHRLDRTWHAQHRRSGTLVRYADDLVLLCPTKERADAALAAVTSILADLGLALNDAKTHLVDLREDGAGFDFLGFHHRRVWSNQGRMFFARWPSDRSVQAARDRIRAHTDRRSLSLPPEQVVGQVNRFVVGWRNYYRWGNSARAFSRLDHFVYQRLARWLTNKHGRRGHAWGLRLLTIGGGMGLQRFQGTVRNSTA